MKKYWVILLIIVISCSIQVGSANSTLIHEPFTLDTGVNPGDDLFGYVNNIWVADHPIPANKSSYTSFIEVNEKTQEKLRTLFEEETNRYNAGEESMVGRLNTSGMDLDTINKLGIIPLADELEKIDAITSRDDMLNVSAHFVEYGIHPFFIYYADQDPTNSSWIIPQVEQGGLGLPERDYYFRNDSESITIQKAYRDHIRNIFLLMNESKTEADHHAKIVYGIEEAMASSQYTNVENRDPINTTHIMAWTDLESTYPDIGWEQLVAINGSGRSDQINLHQLTFVSKLDDMFRTVPLDDWKVFLRYKFIDSLSPYLSAPFDDENFTFYSHILNGAKTPEPRWKRVLNTVNNGIPDEVGKRYVDAYFNPDAREKAKFLTHAIRETLHEHILNLTWMSNTTKQAALEKLDTMGEKIGYPDVWRDYSGMNLTDTYVTNVLEMNKFSSIHGPDGLDKIGKPVDRSLWWMSPQTVNAYYTPTLNEIVFPAAIFQPPFFDPEANDSVNYGGIGTVIGHELTHGFDDSGRQFDKDGNLRDWWTPDDADRFKNQTTLLVDQYNRFEVVPGVFENGNLTLGENIADFGGLTLSYHAWERYGKDNMDQVGADNITPAQKVFLSYAGIWRGTARDEYLRAGSYSDPHSWVKFRANGAPFNIPEFYEAFPAIGPNNKLYRSPEQRPVIW